MNKIGLIGGLGPLSTLDYYKGIIKAFDSTYEETGYPEITIESCNIKEALTFSNQNNWNLLADLLLCKCELLQKAGCSFAAIASNTPHKVFKNIERRTTLPLLSIIEATANYASLQGQSKLLLLGTKFTMTSDFFQEVFDKYQIELVVPSEEDINYIHDKIFSELEFGIIEPETKKRLIAITNNETDKQNCDGAIMGCTELPLIIKKGEIKVNYLDATAIHIEKIVETCKQ